MHDTNASRHLYQLFSIFDSPRPVCGDIQVLEQSAVGTVNAAVDRQLLPASPRILGNRRAAYVVHLLDHIKLTKPLQRLRRLRPVQRLLVFLPDILDMPEPIVAQAQSILPKRRFAPDLEASGTNVF